MLALISSEVGTLELYGTFFSRIFCGDRYLFEFDAPGSRLTGDTTGNHFETYPELLALTICFRGKIIEKTINC